MGREESEAGGMVSPRVDALREVFAVWFITPLLESHIVFVGPSRRPHWVVSKGDRMLGHADRDCVFVAVAQLLHHEAARHIPSGF